MNVRRIAKKNPVVCVGGSAGSVAKKNTMAVLSDNAIASPTTKDQNIICIKEKGRLYRQKETGYNRRSLVETAMFRYKTIIGGQLRSGSFENRKIETRIGVAMLDKMTNLGMPVSVRA